MRQIRFGMIGYKFMGRAHSSALSRIHQFFEPDAQVVMQALCGRDARWLNEAASRMGWASTETEWRTLVNRPDIDVVDIVTPSNLHAMMVLGAVEAGKHIFCEKPLAATLEDARLMLEAVRKAGVKHQVGFNYRFCPALVLAKQMIDRGKLGKLFHFRGYYLQDWIIDPEFPLVWRLDKAVAGSGSHGDLGAHVIDAARFLVGEFDRVMGISRTFVKTRPIVERMEGLSGKAAEDAPRGEVTVDDATIFLSEFKNGAIGTIEATRFAQGHKNNLSLEINGEKGSIRFSFERMNELEYFCASDEAGLQGWRTIQVSECIHPYWSHWWPAGHVIGYDQTFVHELYEFVQSVAQDRPCSPDFEDGMRCSQVLEAVERSCERGAWVDVDSL